MSTETGSTLQDPLALGEGLGIPTVDVRDIGGIVIAGAHPKLGETQTTGVDSEKQRKLALAEEWLGTQGDQTEPVPETIASEVSILAQKKVNELAEEDMVDDDYFTFMKIRDNAIETAPELDFELLQLSGGKWPLQAKLNAMHGKFKNVPAEGLAKFLGPNNGGAYEFRALRLVNIIDDHAPDLLTEDLKAIVDPTLPVWRSSSAHASIIVRNSRSTNLDPMRVDQMPTSLPVSSRGEYEAVDNETTKPLADMSEEELALYCNPDAIASVREKGYATFAELNLPARETLLTRRLFEATGKSHSESAKQQADMRNRELEHEPKFQEGDFVHATSSPEILESMLTNGLRCGEAIMGNDRSTIKYPFTVSFLEVTPDIAAPESLAERLDLLKNDSYGAINVVLDRGSSATPQTEGQQIGVPNQRQVFGGLPSTEIKAIVIREQNTTPQVVTKVIQAVVKQGVFVPVVSGTTGEPLLTSQQFDQLGLLSS